MSVTLRLLDSDISNTQLWVNYYTALKRVKTPINADRELLLKLFATPLDSLPDNLGQLLHPVDEIDVINLSFKYSAWTTDYNNFKIEDIKMMFLAWAGQRPPISVETHNRKDGVRYGEVKFSKGSASGNFIDDWGFEVDDINEGDDDITPYIEAIAPVTRIGLGVESEFDVVAKTFDEIMENIDGVEAKLIENSERAYKEFEALVEEFIAGRS